MNGVRISVIIPAFGSTPFLADCRAALAAQTFRDFEIIESAPPPDGPQNAGAARNAGLAKARGEWISFIDADDLPKPEMLAEAVAAAERECADVVVFAAEEFDNKTGWVTPLPLRLGAGLGDDVRFASFGSMVWNKLFRASYLRASGIRFQEIKRYNDVAFIMEAMARTDRIFVLPKTLYRYRINAGGLQSTKSASSDLWRMVLDDCRVRLARRNLRGRFAAAFAALEVQIAGDSLPGGAFSWRRILHSIRRRGIVSFFKHAMGRML